MYYVYYLQILKQINQFSVGFTSDLDKRLKQHNNGESLATKPYLPWELIFFEAFKNKADAIRREQYLKTTKGRKGLKLITRESIMKA
ncbi:GIY-YIG nuclease family protein [Candidatus Falkowbacteria bacterium]|nr:GIY-YIG nuclease family protein [Candidatus Falkowbacteria bacterium]